MKKLILGLLVFGLTNQIYAQFVNNSQLPEVELFLINYTYFNKVAGNVIDVDVKALEQEVATFDYPNSDLYNDDYGDFSISFYIPNGMIVAAYDNEGIIVSTLERFKNVSPPTFVTRSLLKRFPGWTITKDVYKVKYHQDFGATQTYKITIEKGNAKIHVKTDGDGNILSSKRSLRPFSNRDAQEMVSLEKF